MRGGHSISPKHTHTCVDEFYTNKEWLEALCTLVTCASIQWQRAQRYAQTNTVCPSALHTVYKLSDEFVVGFEGG